MIRKFVDRFIENQGKLEDAFRNTFPNDYGEIVNKVIEVISNDYDDPDPKRIHRINDGKYQGTLLFIIGMKGYQPSMYWSVKVSYGTCSSCDTFQGIRGYSVEPVTDQQVKDIMTLALHIVQSIKEV